QDFVRYDMRFDENVGVGEIRGVSDYLQQVRDGTAEMPGVPPEALVDAADRSLASSLLPRFAAGYRQMLGRRFDDGVDLSGGEWQKIALARAYMRSAQLLILDEPTAALDARAEYEVFVRFNQLMAGRMAVVISHRFSTVRMADRILVLSGGQVVEEGSHEALVERGGLYSELFEMQAAGYR
ncbi:MAG TPA: ATP-binding cassette domain-containing protein, partial [Gemmatimonadaceae bacterium]